MQAGWVLPEIKREIAPSRARSVHQYDALARRGRTPQDVPHLEAHPVAGTGRLRHQQVARVEPTEVPLEDGLAGEAALRGIHVVFEQVRCEHFVTGRAHVFGDHADTAKRAAVAADRAGQVDLHGRDCCRRQTGRQLDRQSRPHLRLRPRQACGRGKAPARAASARIRPTFSREKNSAGDVSPGDDPHEPVHRVLVAVDGRQSCSFSGVGGM